MATFVGLDLSLTSTGYSCGETRKIISTKNKGPQRLHDISIDLSILLVELDDPAVAIEGYSFASRNSQAHAIGELGGVVRLTLWNLGIPYVEIPPTCRAKFATGRGNASKGEVLSSVSARTGFVWSGSGADDLCDAFILEEMALAKYGISRFKWPSVNMSGLDKVNWESFDKLHH
jgi:Holliday junction resolvasome RuvABC endonuclease subunit